MTFNPNSDIGGGKVSRRGRNTGIAVGGGLGVIALFVLSQFLGVDLTGLVGGGGGDPAASDSALTECQTGQDANERIDCRMKGAAASLDAYWQQESPAIGLDYASPQPIVLFTEATGTGCVLNTSFNLDTEPIVCTPADALRTFFSSELDALFLGPFIVQKRG